MKTGKEFIEYNVENPLTGLARMAFDFSPLERTSPD